MSIACTYATKQRTDSKKPIVDLHWCGQPKVSTEGETGENIPLRLQSAHVLFSGLLRSSRRVFACRSVVDLSCFVDMMVVVVVVVVVVEETGEHVEAALLHRRRSGVSEHILILRRP